MSGLFHINRLVKHHLNLVPDNRDITSWEIKPSDLDGRGVIATCDIRAGDIIFVDHTLIRGPRTSVENLPGCISCCTLKTPLRLCSNGCGLSVCSEECQNNQSHMLECQLIQSWKRKSTSKDLDPDDFAKNIVPLRALLLTESKKKFLLELATHNSPRHGGEVRFIKTYFEMSQQEEDLMMKACCVLDANAYEMMIVTGSNEQVTLRGLYPVAGLVNHSCTPNTRCDFDAEGSMYLRATSFIPAGAEICTSYTGQLWGTPARRHHLLYTKHFHCSCSRCSDRTELGTNLGALLCLDKTCGGFILPISPLDVCSNWVCETCGLEMSHRQIGTIQTALAKFLGSKRLDSPEEMYDFLSSQVVKILPESNHVVVEMKCRIISLLGKKKGYNWNDYQRESC